MFFWLIRLWARVACFFLYRRIRFEGAKPVENGPLIVVANHFNGLCDVVMAALPYRRTSFWFAARHNFMTGPLMSWLRRQLHMFSIHRAKDAGNTQSNRASFEAFEEVLGEGKALVIFPAESHVPYTLSNFQPGTAHIALTTEKSNDWQLGLKIQPMAITYGDRNGARGDVTVHLGEPISVAEFREKFEQNKKAARKALTAEIESRIRPHVAECAEEDRKLYDDLTAVLTNLKGDARIGAKLSAEAIQAATEDPIHRHRLVQAVDVCRSKAAEMWTRPGIASRSRLSLLLSPVVALIVSVSSIVHIVPSGVAAALSRHYSRKLGWYYTGTVEFVAKTVVFSIWYALLAVGLIVALHDLIAIAAVTLSALVATMARHRYAGAALFVAALISGRRALRELHSSEAELSNLVAPTAA